MAVRPASPPRPAAASCAAAVPPPKRDPPERKPAANPALEGLPLLAEVGAGAAPRPVVAPPAADAARAAEDQRIVRVIEGFGDADYARRFAYRTMGGLAHEQALADILAHLFNHQTHHRGQVHDLLSQTDVPPPSLNLHRVLRPDPVADRGGGPT